MVLKHWFWNKNFCFSAHICGCSHHEYPSRILLFPSILLAFFFGTHFPMNPMLQLQLLWMCCWLLMGTSPSARHHLLQEMPPGFVPLPCSVLSSHFTPSTTTNHVAIALHNFWLIPWLVLVMALRFLSCIYIYLFYFHKDNLLGEEGYYSSSEIPKPCSGETRKRFYWWYL